MCDYSLTAFRSRLAVEGEELVVYRFPTGALGLASPCDVESCRKAFRGWDDCLDPREIPCAVCIPPGARLLLSEIPGIHSGDWSWEPRKRFCSPRRAPKPTATATQCGSKTGERFSCNRWPWARESGSSVSALRRAGPKSTDGGRKSTASFLRSWFPSRQRRIVQLEHRRSRHYALLSTGGQWAKLENHGI